MSAIAVIARDPTPTRAKAARSGDPVIADIAVIGTDIQMTTPILTQEQIKTDGEDGKLSSGQSGRIHPSREHSHGEE